MSELAELREDWRDDTPLGCVQGEIDQAIRARGRVWYWSYHQVGCRAPRLMAFAARARARVLRL